MTHTRGPWTASWAENGIAALRDSEGKHFANFRNVRSDDISTVSADLAVVVAAPAMLNTLIMLTDCNLSQPARAAVEAAIAKATGGAT